MNWEAGLVLASRSDGKGQKIDGLAGVGEAFAARAKLAAAYTGKRAGRTVEIDVGVSSRMRSQARKPSGAWCENRVFPSLQRIPNACLSSALSWM